MTDDMPGLEEAMRAGRHRYNEVVIGPVPHNDMDGVRAAIRTAYPIIAAAVREQVAKEIEGER